MNKQSKRAPSLAIADLDVALDTALARVAHAAELSQAECVAVGGALAPGGNFIIIDDGPTLGMIGIWPKDPDLS